MSDPADPAAPEAAPTAASPESLLAAGREHLREKRVREADDAFEAALAAAHAPLRARLAAQAGLLALRAAQPRLAIRWYRKAGDLDPSDPELRHDRGLAHLEVGEVGLAAQAQAEALVLDPQHTGARAQRAAALEALGDDAGAAADLRTLLESLGPQPALHARRISIEQSAARAADQRLVGGSVRHLLGSALIGTTFTRALPHLRAQFADLRVDLGGERGERIDRLLLNFDDMQSSMQRNDLQYGGTTQDEHGRTVPLDEFHSAAAVFLAQAGGVQPQRARRLLEWLLTKEAGLGPHSWAGLLVGWSIEEQAGDAAGGQGGGARGARRYGLSVALPANPPGGTA